MHDVSVNDRYAALAGIKSSTFELAHEFESVQEETIPSDDSIIPSDSDDVAETVDIDKIISEYKENVVSLLESHEDVDDQLIEDLFEKYKNEPNITTMINNILQEINQHTISYDLVLIDGKIDVAEKSDGSEPAEEVNGVEKPGDIININIDGNERIVTFSEDSDGNITMLIETDDPNVEPVNLPADFVMSVRNALQTINPD